MSHSDPSFSLLESIDSPVDLRALPAEKLPQLANELRRFLIQSVASSGGHLSAGLGTMYRAAWLAAVSDKASLSELPGCRLLPQLPSS